MVSERDEPDRARDDFGREDIPARAVSPWRRFAPGPRLRLGTGGVVLVAAVGGALVLSIWKGPDWTVNEPAGLGTLPANERVIAENALEQTRNQVRTTLVQSIGGALVLLTFAVGLGQLRTARQGQVTDRFTKTIDQLGNNKIEVRLGGIYALQQIAAERGYARPIAEIYEGFLKTQASSIVDESAARPHRNPNEPSPLRPDLQAVLRILVLEGLWETATSDQLDLSDIIVPSANLAGARLSGCLLLRANLRWANLRGAKLTDSDLRHADLRSAILEDAEIMNADLRGAVLERAAKERPANLARANLWDAKLGNARLGGAELPGCDLSLADLTNADLSSAILNGATLDGAALWETLLVDAHLTGATLIGANLIGADLTRARLIRADFTGATMTKVILTDAVLDASTSFKDATIDDVTQSQIDELLARTREAE